MGETTPYVTVSAVIRIAFTTPDLGVHDPDLGVERSRSAAGVLFAGGSKTMRPC